MDEPTRGDGRDSGKDSTEPNGGDAVDNTPAQLIKLIKECRPSLDASGTACCFLRGPDGDGSTCQLLRSQVTKDYLIYRYRRKHKSVPKHGQVEQAIAWVHGQLWYKASGAKAQFHLVTQLIETLSRSNESWVGTASQFREELVIANRNSEDGLPASPEATGMLLSKLEIECRQVGIALFRPTRRANKRLWAWSRMTFCDSDDGSVTAGERRPHSATGREAAAESDGDSCDGFTPTEVALMETYEKEVNHAKNKP